MAPKRSKLVIWLKVVTKQLCIVVDTQYVSDWWSLTFTGHSFHSRSNKKLSYRVDSARQRSLRRSRSFKVTDTDRYQGYR